MSAVPGPVGGGADTAGASLPSSSKKRTKIVFLNPTELGNWNQLENNAEQKLLDKDDILRYEKLLKNNPPARKITESVVPVAKTTSRPKPAKNVYRKKTVGSYRPWLEDDSDEADAGLEDELDDDEYFRRLEEERRREDEAEAQRKKEAARAKKAKSKLIKPDPTPSRTTTIKSARRCSQPNYAALAGLTGDDSDRENSEFGDGTVSSYSGSKLDFDETYTGRNLSPHEELDEGEEEEDFSERSYPLDEFPQSPFVEEEDTIMVEDEEQFPTRPDATSKITSDQFSTCPTATDPFTMAMLNVDPIQLLYQSPHLALPPSASDLVCPKRLIMDAFSIYEVLNRYNRLLRLSPFKVEDFLAALVANENSVLLAEVHIALLKALIREDDAAATLMYPVDSKDSITITFHLIDRFTWPHLLATYLSSVKSSEAAALAAASGLSAMSMAAAYAAGAAGCGPTSTGGADTVLTAALFPPDLIPLDPAYPFVPVETRVAVLRGLVNLILATGPVRGDILRDGYLPHEDHCRVCHQSGDVLCCDGCTAVYHLTCLNPPLQSAPSSTWICPVCIKQQVTGVSECLTEAERAGKVHRREPIGTDRAGRVYWYIGRRILVEPVNYAQREPCLPGLMDGVYDPQWVEQYLVEQVRTGEMAPLPHSPNGTNDESAASTVPYIRCNPMVDYALEPPVYYYSCVEQVMELRGRLSTQWEPWLCERLDELMPRLSTEMRSTETMTEEGMELFCQAHPDCKRITFTSTSASATLKNVFSVFELETARSKSNLNSMDLNPTSDAVPPQATSTAPVKTECAFDQVIGPKSCYAPDCLENTLQGIALPEVDEPNESNIIVAADVKNCFYRNRDGITIETARFEQDDRHRSATVLTEDEHLELSLTSCLPTSVVQTTGTKLIAYRLSDEGLWRSWTNAYTCGVWSGGETTKPVGKKHVNGNDLSSADSGFSSNLLLTRQQFMEEKERRRLLGNKFNMTDLALDMWQYLEPPAVAHQLSVALEFMKVPGSLSEDLFSSGWLATVPHLLDVLRFTMCYFEAQLPTCFYSPVWRCFRKQWIASVLRATNPVQLVEALAQFEAAIRPVCYQRVWSNALGHIAYERTTMAQREEDRRIRMMDRSASSSTHQSGSAAVANLPANVIRTCNPGPIRHSVWKYRGEEYRRLGGDGWMWLSSTRRSPGQEASLLAAAYPRLNQVPCVSFKKSQAKRGLQHGIGWGVCPNYLQGELPVKPPKPSECRGHVLHPITGIPLYLNPRRTSYVIPSEELHRIQTEASLRYPPPVSLTENVDASATIKSESADDVKLHSTEGVTKSEHPAAESPVSIDTSSSAKLGSHQTLKTLLSKTSTYTDERNTDLLHQSESNTDPPVLNVSYCLQERIHFPPVIQRAPINPSLRSRRLRHRLDRLLVRRQSAADIDRRVAEAAQTSMRSLESDLANLAKQRATLEERLSSLNDELQELRDTKARTIKERMESAKKQTALVSKGPISNVGPIVACPNETTATGMTTTKPLIQHSVLDFANGPRFRIIAPRVDKPHCTALYQRSSATQQTCKATRRPQPDTEPNNDGDQQLRRSSRRQKATRHDPDFVVDFDDDDEEEEAENEEPGNDEDVNGTDSAEDSDSSKYFRRSRRTIPQFDGAGDEDSSDAGSGLMMASIPVVTLPTGSIPHDDAVKRLCEENPTEPDMPPDKMVPLVPSSGRKQVFQVISSSDSSAASRFLRVVRPGDGPGSKQPITTRLPINGDPTGIAVPLDASDGDLQRQLSLKPVQVVLTEHVPATSDSLSHLSTSSVSTLPVTQVLGTNQSPKTTTVVNPNPAIPTPIVLPQGFRLASGATPIIAASPLRLSDGKLIRTVSTVSSSGVIPNRLPAPASISVSTPLRFILSTANTATCGTGSVMVTATPISAVATSIEVTNCMTTTMTTNATSEPNSTMVLQQPAILRRTLATVSTAGPALPSEVKYFTIPQPQSIASMVAASTARKIVCGEQPAAPAMPVQPSVEVSTPKSRRSIAKAERANEQAMSRSAAAVLLKPRVMTKPSVVSTPSRLISMQARIPTEEQLALDKAVAEATERLKKAETQAASVRSELAALDKQIADLQKQLSQQRALLTRGNVSTAQPYSLIRSAHDTTKSSTPTDEVLLPASLPPVNTYVWPPMEWPEEYKKRQSTGSLFRWNAKNLRWLILSAGRRELPGYDTEKKRLAQIIWPYPTAKPTLSETWRFRLSQLRLGPDRRGRSLTTADYKLEDYGQDLANIALLIRTLWHCIRWDDILGEPADNVHVRDADGRPCFRELTDYEDAGTGRLGESAYCTRRIVGIQPLDKHWNRVNYLMRLTYTRPLPTGAPQGRRRPGRPAKRGRRPARANVGSSASESSTASPAPHSGRRSKNRKAAPKQDPDYDPFRDDTWWGHSNARRRSRRPMGSRLRRSSESDADDGAYDDQDDDDWPPASRSNRGNNRTASGPASEHSAAPHQEVRVEERWMTEDNVYLWEIRTFMNEYLPPTDDYLHPSTKTTDETSLAAVKLRRPARLSTVPPSIAEKEETVDTKEQPEGISENRAQPSLQSALASALTEANSKHASSGIVWNMHSGFRFSGDPTVRLSPALSTRRRAYQRDSSHPDLPISPSILEAKAKARSLAASHAAKASAAARRMRNERALLEQRVRSLRTQIVTRRRIHLSLTRLISLENICDVREQNSYKEPSDHANIRSTPISLSPKPLSIPRGGIKRGRPPLSSRNRQSSQEASPRPKDVSGSRIGARAFSNEDQENEPHRSPTPTSFRRFTRGSTFGRRGRGRGRGRASRLLSSLVTVSRKYRKPEKSSVQSPSSRDRQSRFDDEDHNLSSAPSTPSTTPGLGDETLEQILIPSGESRPTLRDTPRKRGYGVSRGRGGRGRGSRGRATGRVRQQPIRLPAVFASSSSPPAELVAPTVSADSATLYCLCKTPYDPTREYLGCDLCQDWFHFECVGLSSSESAQLGESWHCPDCRKAETDANEMVYCLCRTPYEPLRVYIACDGCDEWYHAECVGMTSEQAASHTGTYICPICAKNAPTKPEDVQIPSDEVTPVKADPDTSSANVTTIYETPLELDTKMQLLELVKDMMHHKMSWPLVQLLDPQKYPAVEKLPDLKNLCTLLTELTQDAYPTLGDFAFAMNRVFSDARTVYPRNSPEFHCADVMEAFFIQQMKRIKAGLSHHD